MTVLAALKPSPDHARALLRRELLRPEYHQQNLIQRFLDWIRDKLDSTLNSASHGPSFGTLGAMVVFLGLLVLLAWFASRARSSTRAPGVPGAVLTEEVLTAADLRARADAALAAGDAGTAVVDGFRSLTLRAIERGLIDDQPGATAHEVTVRLGAVFDGRSAEISRAGALFDLVLYGERPATPAQAQQVLATADALAENVGAR